MSAKAKQIVAECARSMGVEIIPADELPVLISPMTDEYIIRLRCMYCEHKDYHRIFIPAWDKSLSPRDAVDHVYRYIGWPALQAHHEHDRKTEKAWSPYPMGQVA